MLWAQTAAPEYQLKTAYLFNFAKFTEWPGSALPANSTLNICTTGRDPFGDALNSLDGKSAQNRAVRVKRGLKLEEIKGCHLLFVGDTEEKRLTEINKVAESDGILTIAEFDGFLDAGGMMFLVTSDKRVLFDVNIESAQKSGLKISSHVLKLARTVKGKNQ